MSHPKQPERCLESPTMPSKNGILKVSSPPLEHLEEKDCMISLSYVSNVFKDKPKIKIKLKNASATVESRPSTKEVISKIKSNPCKNSSQRQPSSLISDQVLISKEKAFVPFWNKRAKKLSRKLWLPTEIDCVGSHSNSLNGCFKSMESNSWFSIKAWSQLNPMQNSLKTSLPSSTYSIVGSMVKEDTTKVKTRKSKLKKSSKPLANLCRRIRLFPNQETKQKLKSWFGCARKTYNLALNAIKENKIAINTTELRKQFTNNSKIREDDLYPYLLETPAHIRAGAVTDLVEAYQSNFAKQKLDPSFKFDIKYRSKKNDQAILIEADSGTSIDHQNHVVKMYPSLLGKEGIKFFIRHRDRKKNMIILIDHDCRLIRDTMGRYYLNIPCYVNACDNQARCNDTQESWGALDPGSRTFQTIYTIIKGVAYKIGQGDISRIYRLCLHLDKLLSIKSKKLSKKDHEKGKVNRQSIQKKIKKLRLRIKHIVDEVHWKVIHFLVSNFTDIVIPVFGVQSMINRTTRKISSNTVRKLLGWRHYTFRQRLINTAKRTSTRIHVVGEEYTTKTCGSCMKLYDVKSSEVYKCPSCGVRMDRDLNASRNIFMMNCTADQDMIVTEDQIVTTTEDQIVTTTGDQVVVDSPPEEEEIVSITDLDFML